MPRTSAGGSPRTAPTRRSSCWTSDEGLVGVGEMAPLGAFYAPRSRRAARAGVAELAPAAARARPARATACAACARSRDARPALRQVRARHGGARPRREGGGRVALLLPRRSLRRERRALPLGLAGHAGDDGAQRGGLRGRRLPPHPGQGRRRSGCRTSSACRRCARPCRPASCSSAMPTAPGRPGRRARSCARRPGSRSRSSSRACRTRSAGPCARSARIRSCSTSASTRSRRCSRPIATASPTA